LLRRRTRFVAIGSKLAIQNSKDQSDRVLSLPAILKAYIDYIVVAGVTFKYTPQGAVGLLRGKKAIYIVARGGEYMGAPTADIEMGERYLRTIFAFMGVTDFTTVAAEGLDIAGADVDAIVNAAAAKAQQAAKTFGAPETVAAL
jgi:FMN-dependent NADH-azoreductase